MARRAKAGAEGASAQRSNGYDPQAVKSFAARVENLEAEIDEFKAEFDERCEPIKEDIKEVLEEAEAAGLPKKEFKKILKRRKLERKIEAERAALNEYEQTNYDNLRLALGDLKDLPLGQAAMAKHSGNGAGHASQ